MFRGDAAHDGAYRGDGPRQLHRVKWKFPTGDRIVSSPVYQDGVIYFGGDDGNVYAVDAADGRQLWKRRTGGPVPSTPAIAGNIVYVGSYDGKFYALDAKTGQTQWKFSHRRRAAIRGEEAARPAAEEPDDRRCVRRLPVEPRRGGRLGVFRQRRRPRLLARCRFRSAQLEIPDGRRGPCVARVRRRRRVLRQLGQLLLRGRRQDRRREMALSRRRGSADPQPGRLPVVAGGRERRRLYGVPGFEAVRDRRRDRPREVAFRRRRKLGDQLARGGAGQGDLRHVGFEPLSSCWMPRPARSSSGSRARPTCSRRRRWRATRSTSACSTARWRRAISRAERCCGSSRPKRRSATRAGC